MRTEYTCIGDAVNVAARLCALAGPGEILVGERTRELVQGSQMAFEELPPVRLEGQAAARAASTECCEAMSNAPPVPAPSRVPLAHRRSGWWWP